MSTRQETWETLVILELPQSLLNVLKSENFLPENTRDSTKWNQAVGIAGEERDDLN